MDPVTAMFVQMLTAHLNQHGVKEFTVKKADLQAAEESGQMIILDDESDPEAITLKLLSKEEAEAFMEEVQKTRHDCDCNCEGECACEDCMCEGEGDCTCEGCDESK